MAKDPMTKVLEAEARFISEVKALRNEVLPPVVQNKDSGVWHRMPELSSPVWSAGGHKTCCGWRVGVSNARLGCASSLPPDPLDSQRCERCLPQLD